MFNERDRRLLSAAAARERHPAAVQHRSELPAKAFSGETVQVEVDGVVDVHQQETDDLNEQIQ